MSTAQAESSPSLLLSSHLLGLLGLNWGQTSGIPDRKKVLNTNTHIDHTRTCAHKRVKSLARITITTYFGALFDDSARAHTHTRTHTKPEQSWLSVFPSDRGRCVEMLHTEIVCESPTSAGQVI